MFVDREKQTYLAVLLSFGLLSAGLAWPGSGQALFSKADYFETLPADRPAPILSMDVSQVGSDSLVIAVKSANFNWSKDCNWNEGETPYVEGHAHVYLDGRKVTAMYDQLAYVEDIPPGKHKLTVSLNLLPDHKALLIGDKPAQAEYEFVMN